MLEYVVRVSSSAAHLPREEQLAWKIAEFAAGRIPFDAAAAEIASCRIVDNAAVALAAITRGPVVCARAQALAHPRPGGATLIGLPPATTVDCAWAAWANATAVRELDFHDTFLAADYAHPGDTIPPLIAAAQQCGRTGLDLLRGILVAYEVHVALVKSICLHRYRVDHVAHVAPAAAAGIGALLGLPAPVIYQALNQTVHLAFSTRQSRKGEISSWKASAPAHVGKLAVEAVDRAMRGGTAPSPIYEGEDSVIAWMLDGPDAHYTVRLPAPGEAPRGILETYGRAHSAEYQAQAIIDLAIEMSGQVDLSRVREVVLYTSHHTHSVIGSGANDPQKTDPDATRETLDHSILYILAVALEDGAWHHELSYTPERSHRPSTVTLWRKVRTVEDLDWTRRYHDPDPSRRAFGGRLEIVLDDGTVVSGEKAAADAHPNGASPWWWDDYVGKFDRLALPLTGQKERDRFIDLAGRLGGLTSDEVRGLNPGICGPDGLAVSAEPHGIFDWPAD